MSPSPSVDVGKKGLAKTMTLPLDYLIVSRQNMVVLFIIVNYILNIWVGALLKNSVPDYPSCSLSKFQNRNSSKTSFYLFCIGLSIEFLLLGLTELHSSDSSNLKWLFPSHRQTCLKRLSVLWLEVRASCTKEFLHFLVPFQPKNLLLKMLLKRHTVKLVCNTWCWSYPFALSASLRHLIWGAKLQNSHWRLD